MRCCPRIAVWFLAVLAWGVLRTSGDEEVPSLRDNPLYGRIVYLAPGDQSVWIAPPEQVAEAGILVTATHDEFRQAVTIDTAAIIIDREWVSQVDEEWIREMLEDGKVLVGARLNLSDLTAAFGVASVTGQHAGYQPSRLFYSLFSQPTCADDERQVRWAAGSDYLDHNQRGQFRLLIHQLDNYSQVSCVSALPAPSNPDGQ